MLAEGAPVPHVTVIDQELEPVGLADLAAEGPFLLVFYLYDWTST
jgi:peroxiredoxin